ncbi:hypothetical protein N0V83_010384 [Neocucurbitaria cava]|uniref:Oxo-4-hydroxy-4-carboxy-5-ureidoimidazoline decarboxylase domain-containing protein n=1 Tax=Neocucurbitaria cava TaxID=798079 RepID=A0A9W8XY93_9PLEO|nr:hypothetical protein N0V83_010384 [Neocucurbitaria cava]
MPSSSPHPLHALTLPVLRSTTFPDYSTLIVAVSAQLQALAKSEDAGDVEKLEQILCSHPRLGEKKVGSLSEASRREQAQLQQGMGEGEKLRKLNEDVFVNGRARPVIMENMRARIDRGDIKAERQEAIQVTTPVI